ncbi:MAG: glycosyltransferase family 4 protein, partial [Candidatus Micrarchaeota archaeon]
IVMDICMLNPFFHPYQGGTEKHVLEVSRRLAKKHDVTVLTARLPNTLPYEEIGGIKVKRLPAMIFYDAPHPLPPPVPVSPFFLTSLISEIPKHEIFHMHNRFFYNMLDEALIKRYGGKILGLTLHNARLKAIEPVTDFVGDLYDDFVGKQMMNACHALAAVSKDTLVNTAPANPKPKTRVIYNGVDINLFSPKNEEGTIRKKYNLGEDRLILSIARLQTQKGFVYLLQAFAEIVKEEKDVTLVILGKGPQEGYLKKFAADLGLGKSVIFITEKITEADLTELYAACEFFALASVWEPFGMVFCEAMASGKPVIGTNVGGIPEIIQDESGMLFEIRNASQIKEKMLALLRDEKLRKRMGANARERCVKNFTWELSAQGYEELYKPILEERKLK